MDETLKCTDTCIIWGPLIFTADNNCPFSQSHLEASDVCSVDAYGALDFRSHDLASLNSVRSSSEMLLSLKDGDQQTIDGMSCTASVRLDQPINHEEPAGYYEMEDTKPTPDRITSNTSEISTHLEHQHSGEHKGYIDYGNKKMLDTSGYNYRDHIDAFNNSIDSEHPVDYNNDDYVNESDGKTRTLTNENPLTDLCLEMNSDAVTHELELTTKFGADQSVIDDCASVMFDFTTRNDVCQDDDSQVAVQTLADSASAEATSVAVAFDLGPDMQSNDTEVTLLQEAATTIEMDRQISGDYGEASESGFTVGSLHDSIINTAVTGTDTGYVVSLDSGISFELSSEIMEEDICANLDDNLPLKLYSNNFNLVQNVPTFSNTPQDTNTSSGYVSGGTLRPQSVLSTNYVSTWFT